MLLEFALGVGGQCGAGPGQDAVAVAGSRLGDPALMSAESRDPPQNIIAFGELRPVRWRFRRLRTAGRHRRFAVGQIGRSRAVDKREGLFKPVSIPNPRLHLPDPNTNQFCSKVIIVVKWNPRERFCRAVDKFVLNLRLATLAGSSKKNRRLLWRRLIWIH
jgi:hypothetical protein